jgi:DNA replicative helicase MCM subunit Mcm2 (Cdc46/Mcm family)
LLKPGGTDIGAPSISFDEEEVIKFQEFSKQPEILKRLSEHLNPTLLGLEKVRTAVLLSMVSLADSNQSKNRVHILITGETSTGKTAIIRWAADNLWGLYGDSHTSGAGLVGRAAGAQFKKGLISEANHSTLFIDELDKIETEDLDALLSAMQTGRVYIHKDQVDKNFEAQTRIIAACNNITGFREEFLSRFDLVIEAQQLNKETVEALIRQKVNDWNRIGEIISEEFFKRYMLYVAQHPVMLPEDREWLADAVIHEMRFGGLQGADIRKIESAIRIGLSIARLKLKDEIDREDLKEAFDLIKKVK